MAYQPTPAPKDLYRIKLEAIKKIASEYPGVTFSFTFREPTGFQGGELVINPEDDIKDIERAFKSRRKLA